jgi:protein SCO1
LPRPALIAGAVAVVLLLAVGGTVLARQRATTNGLTGGVFTDTPPAPDFSLRDQNGQTVTMSQLQGKVVAITFLYTHCPDVCPLIASNLAAAETKLGADAAKTEVVAVSVDPVGDTLPAVRKFTADHSLDGQANWHYLMGSPGQLEPVWSAYHVGASAATEGAISGVDHSAMVYLTDTSGKLRVILPANVTVSDLVHDMQTLAASG